MLLDTKGNEVNPATLPKNRRAREAVLATLREVLVPAAPKGKLFSLETRAKFGDYNGA